MNPADTANVRRAELLRVLMATSIELVSFPPPPSLLPTCGVVIIHFLSDYELGQHSTRVQLLICKVFCLFGRQKLFYLAPSVLFQMWARIKVAPSAAAGPEH